VIFREGDDGHDFRSGGDDEAGLAAAALFFAVERNGDAAQGAVVHVDGTGPGDTLGIKMQIIAVEEMRIDKSGEQIVRRGDGMKIAVEMEIDFRTRFDLRKAAPGGAALHAEHRAERRLARGDDHSLPDVGETLGKADGGDGLAFSRSCRRSGGDND